jgi:hypothetical protein
MTHREFWETWERFGSARARLVLADELTAVSEERRLTEMVTGILDAEAIRLGLVRDIP